MHFEAKLKKGPNGEMTYLHERDRQARRSFDLQIPVGGLVHVYMEVLSDDGSLGQLAKVHKLIRILSSHTGNSFDEIKTMVKYRAGLYLTRSIEGRELCICKSFGDCSFDELSGAIASAIELGQQLNLNL